MDLAEKRRTAKAARGVCFHEIYRISVLKAMAHGGGTLGLLVGDSDIAKDIGPGEKPEESIVPCNG